MSAPPPELDAALRPIRPELGQISLHDSWLDTDGEPGEPLAPSEGLTWKGVVGEGGLALVRLAVQNTLGRDIAVKSVHPNKLSATYEHLLLREAWVTGALDHPNIVPVYDITRDDAGRSLILLKRIQGKSWAELLWNPELLEAAVGDADPLEWNLQVLLQVCNAASFAHARGFLHRDLKPGNVMIGSFGEVYVVDWGLALRLDPEGDPRIPLAGSAAALAGTPAYMAPEMLGEGAPLNALTDVFLLGAILYEILTGRAPWGGSVDAALFDRIRRCEVVMPPEVPAHLGAICLKAMRREPAERFPSVDALRDALRGYLRRRGADALSMEAEERLSELEALLPGGERQRVYDLHGQCRFGFQQALAAWPDHAEARAGLAHAARLMVRYELDRRDLAAAEALLLEADDPALSQRARDLQLDLQAEQARLDALKVELKRRDPAPGRRARLAVVGGMGLLWMILAGVGVGLEERLLGTRGYALSQTLNAVFLATVALLAWAGRASLLTTDFNRQIVGSILLFISLQIPLDLAAWLLGLPVQVAYTLHILLWATTSGMVALSLDRRFAPAAIGFLACFLAAAAEPDWLFVAITLGCMAFTFNVVSLWARDDRQPP